MTEAVSDAICVRAEAPPCAATHKLPAAKAPAAAEKPRPWLAHLEGRTLVEGTGEAYRHPSPGWPEPLDTLSPLGEEGLEQICTGLVNHVYPESEYTPRQRERMLAASRQRFVDGLRNNHAQFRAEVEELQSTQHAEAKRMCVPQLPRSRRGMPARRPALPPPAQRAARRRGSVQRGELQGAVGALYRRDHARERRAQDPQGAPGGGTA